MLNQLDIFALALAAITFVPGYMVGLRLSHPHASPLCGFAASVVIYIAARMILAIFLWVVLPVVLLWLYFRFHRDISDWARRFAAESGIRVRELRRPAHVNDALDRLLNRREEVAEELSLINDSGKNKRHVQVRLRQELQVIDQTLHDLL